MLGFSFWCILLAFLATIIQPDEKAIIQVAKKPKDYDMDVGFDFVFGLGLAAIFYFCGIIPHTILVVGALIGDTLCRGSIKKEDLNLQTTNQE